MKKHQLKNYLKLGILLFGIILLATNCQTDDNFKTQANASQSKHSVKSISPSQFIQINYFKNMQAQLETRNRASLDANLQYRTEAPATYEFLNEPVLVTTKENKESYSAAVKKVGEENSLYNTKLVIQNINGEINNLLMQVSKDGSYIIINDLSTGKQYIQHEQEIDSSEILGRELSPGCTETTTVVSITYGCVCSGEAGVIRTFNVTIIDCIGPETELPPIFIGGAGGYDNGSNNGNSGEGLPGTPSDQNPPPPIYIYEGEQECFSSGECTLQLYWAYTETISEIEQLTEIITDEPHANSLISQVNNQKIKNKITALQEIVNSTLNEDGMQFDLIPNSNPIDYNEVAPIADQTGTDHITFPDVRINTLVNLHLHPKYGLIEGISTPQELSPIFSDADVYFMLEFFEDTNNNEDISSLIVSTEGVFALRVTDTERATFMKNKLDIRRHWRKYLERFLDKVLNSAENEPPYTNQQIIDNFINFLNTYQINNSDNGQGFGLSLFQAVLDANGNITGWTQP